MPSPIHLAVIGYGLAGRVFHAPLIGHTPGLALHSVVTSQHAVVSATLPGVRVCATAEEVFDDQAVDAVVIATPNALHAPLALAALQAGKHVLVDKPFALDALAAKIDQMVRKEPEQA